MRFRQQLLVVVTCTLAVLAGSRVVATEKSVAATSGTVTGITQLLYQYQPGPSAPFPCDGTATTTTKSKFVYDVHVHVSGATNSSVQTLVYLNEDRGGNPAELWEARTIDQHIPADGSRYFTYQLYVGDGLYVFETKAGDLTASCSVRKI